MKESFWKESDRTGLALMKKKGFLWDHTSVGHSKIGRRI